MARQGRRAGALSRLSADYSQERLVVADAIAAPWLSRNVETRALGYAVRELVPEHLAEIKTRRIVEIDKVEREVRARLNREINYWTHEQPGCVKRNVPARNSASTRKMPKRPRRALWSGYTGARVNSTASAKSRPYHLF